MQTYDAGEAPTENRETLCGADKLDVSLHNLKCLDSLKVLQSWLFCKSTLTEQYCVIKAADYVTIAKCERNPLQSLIL